MCRRVLSVGMREVRERRRDQACWVVLSKPGGGGGGYACLFAFASASGGSDPVVPTTMMLRSLHVARSRDALRVPVVRRSRRLGRDERSDFGNGVRSRIVLMMAYGLSLSLSCSRSEGLEGLSVVG